MLTKAEHLPGTLPGFITNAHGSWTYDLKKPNGKVDRA